ncbi:MAG: IS5 family transposase, partial [Candidatus Micrarchaeota archaeon]|nr:IS5 family transposase [Candidatus Micrarchaeota archaeon]
AYAVRYFLSVEKETPQGKITKEVRITYKQEWSAYNKAQTQEITLFDKLLKDLVEEVEEPEQSMGRPRIPLKEQVFCAIQKVYSQLSSRRARSLYVNAEQKKQIDKAPSYNMINLALNREDITPILNKLVTITAEPLKSIETEFAIDSTGFRTSNFGEYAEDKYNLNREKKWVKAHVCIGVKTHTITAVEISNEKGSDCRQFAPLVENTAKEGFNMKEVSADRAYSSRDNYELIREIGGQAFIPFRSNATGTSRGSPLWKKMFHYFQLHQEEFMAHYHKRSNVETTFHMIKMKFGDKLKSKNPKAQENELLCKIIAHNIVVLIHEMHELGIKPEFY